jgi:Ser/Thr protein kinase RdoA (MazF antagonist)
VTTTGLLLHLCRQLLDPDAQPLGCHAGHDHTSLLRASTRHGEVIVKAHRSGARHAQELRAYHRWVPALGDHAPRLLAEIDDPPAIILTALAGQPVAELDLPPATERDVLRQAGALLRTLHRAEAPHAEPDMTAWLAARGEVWLHLAQPILPAGKRADIRAHLHALADLGPLPAVPCHLDCTPRNLLRAPDGAISLIDFEHARHDLAARDLVRLAHRVWRERPDLEDAFLASYGPLSDTDRQVIEHCTHLDTLTAAVRATGGNIPADQPAPQPRGNSKEPSTPIPARAHPAARITGRSPP